METDKPEGTHGSAFNRIRQVPSLDWYNAAFNSISARIGGPTARMNRGAVAYRFEQRTDQEAILLKLARYISGLNAGKLLMEAGFLQELCTLQRVLDEIHEDILFLVMPAFGFPRTDFHQIYLEHFWKEEPDFRDFSGEQTNRWSIPRKRDRGYLARVNPADEADHGAIAVSAYLGRIYSGYVHAAAPQLLEMFDPKTEKFRLNGYKDSPLWRDHRSDFENQFFRGIICILLLARFVGDEKTEMEAAWLHNRLDDSFQ